MNHNGSKIKLKDLVFHYYFSNPIFQPVMSGIRAVILVFLPQQFFWECEVVVSSPSNLHIFGGYLNKAWPGTTFEEFLSLFRLF